jgi:hypothetical protein
VPESQGRILHPDLALNRTTVEELTRVRYNHVPLDHSANIDSVCARQERVMDLAVDAPFTVPLTSTSPPGTSKPTLAWA